MKRSRLRCVLASLTLASALATTGCGAGVDAGPTPAPTTSRPLIPATVFDVPDDHRLVWNDEFDGERLDRRKWTVLDDSTFGDGNLELACLRSRNVRVQDGTLVITAERPPAPVPCGGADGDDRFPEGRDYTSGLVETRPHAGFTYGVIELRATTPTEAGRSKGLWPAFWLRPTDGGIGEIDVLEMIGTGPGEAGDRRVHQAIHYDYVGTHELQQNETELDSGSFSEDFHTFTLVWEPDRLAWYLDGRLVWYRDPETTPWFREAFSREMFLRINLAVGGRWPGSPDAETRFPAEYRIDYVRVYQR